MITITTLYTAAFEVARTDALVVAAEKIYRSDNHKGALTERLQKLDALRAAEAAREAARAKFADINDKVAMVSVSGIRLRDETPESA